MTGSQPRRQRHPTTRRQGVGRVALAVLFIALCLLRTAFADTRLAVDRRVLPNGAVLLVSEQRSIPMVVVTILVDAGARRDPPGKQGLADLTSDLLTEGTKARSATQISEAADFIGASLRTAADTDYATLGLTVVSKELDAGLGLLKDILLTPTFPEAEVTRRREAALASLRAAEDNPGYVAQRAFIEHLFAGRPYGHLVSGSEESVRRLRRADVAAFYNAHYRPDRAIVTVVGDVSAADIASRLELALRGWAPGGAPRFVDPAPPAEVPAIVPIQKSITQANIILGQRGIARDNPDYYALTVMNFILGGGGFTSRLLDNIRTKAGLAYSVSSSFSVNEAPGSFQVVMQTKNTSAEDAIQRACAELEQIRREPVSDDELTGAQLYLTGSFPLRLDSNAKIAGFLAQVEFYQLGLDYTQTYAQRIKAVTKDDVLRVAREYLHPDRMLLVAVADLPQAGLPSTPPACRGGE
jgi:zinc protease